MQDELSYWSPLCGLASQLRFWVRVAYRDGTSTVQGRWGQLLTIPTKGYLEGSDGPIPIRDIEWVEVSASCIKGGIAGRPLQIIDVKDQILSGLRGIQLSCELRESTWSIEGLFDDKSVQTFRIFNPFGPESDG